jgi:membrane fusion protein, multidrug efflux system
LLANVTGGGVMSTNDAYVRRGEGRYLDRRVGHRTKRRGGGQRAVDTGRVLYRLDPWQFQIAVDSGKANLAQIALSIDAMKQEYKRMLNNAAAQQAQMILDQTNFDRATTFLHSGTIPQAMFDKAQSTLQIKSNKLASLSEQSQMQLANSPATRICRRRNIRNICRRRRSSRRRSGSSKDTVSGPHSLAPSRTCR